ncbi:MAG: DUF3299 domain-containing protein [Planctomycetia bacterium]|nr:DUF3299 domain-containing protein [Planctomycetia bacterium]
MDRIFVLVASLLVTVGLTTAFVHAADAQAPSKPGAAGFGNVVFAGKPAPLGKDAVDWAVLTAYEYEPGLASLPDPIKALEGKAIVLRGFLLPIAEFDDIHEFCVVPNHMSCCFGMPAGINGQVQVTLRKNERGLPNTSEPIEVRGTFRAIETKDQGILLSIFRLDDATAKVVGY